MTIDSLISDATLIEQTRAGNREAYAELWRRHSQAGVYAARSFSKDFEPDDLVAEAYAKIYAALQTGRGPTSSFRPYLLTTIRNTAMVWARKLNEDSSDDLDSVADLAQHDDETMVALNRTITVSAFRSLPSRWQEVLWYSEVEGLKPHECAPLLGMSANSVAALAYRAREGLRQAWIQAHLNDRNSPPECRWTIERMGAYTRDKSPARDRAKIEAHLDGCARCKIVLSEADQVESRLHVTLIPLALGATGSVGYLAWVQSSSSAAVAAGKIPAAAMGGDPGVLSTVLSTPDPISTVASGTAASTTAGAGTSSGIASIVTSKVGLTVGGILAAAAVTAGAVFVPPLLGGPTATDASAPTTAITSNQSAVEAATGGTGPSESATSSLDEVVPSAVVSPPSVSTTQVLGAPITSPTGGLTSPIFNFEPATTFGSSQPLLTGQAQPGSTVTLIVSGAGSTYGSYTALTSAGGGWEVQLAEAPNGSYTARAYQTNGDNKRSDTNSTTFIINGSAALAAPAIGAVDTGGGIYTPVISGSGTPGSAVSVSVNGVPNTGTVSAAGTWSIDATQGSVVGRNSVTATQISHLTHTQSAASPATSFSLTAPSVTVGPVTTSNITLNVRAAPGTQITITESNGAYSHVVTLAPGTSSDVVNIRGTQAATGATNGFTVYARQTSADGSRSGLLASGTFTK